MAVSTTGKYTFFFASLRLCSSYSSGVYALLCIAALSLFMNSCIFSGGGDGGGNDDEKPGDPAIETLSIVDGQVISSRDIVIQWQGNETAALYRYSFDNVTYEVTPDTSVALSDLGESAHTFVIQALDETQSKSSESDSITFTVDAVRGPGIVFSPRRISTEPSITIYLEDVENLMAAHIELIADNRCVLFGEFVKNKSIVSDGEVIVLSNTGNTQKIFLDIAFAGEIDGLSGSMIPIGTLTVTSLRTGTIIVDPLTAKFRDTDNNGIVINDLDFVRVYR